MKIFDMITINGVNINFSNMGLFDGEAGWIHPMVSIKTFELIFVISGTIFLREENEKYALKKGDVILLDKNKEHGGTEASKSHTSFYWLHFYCDNISAMNLKKTFSVDTILIERVMRELMHLQNESPVLCELAFVKFLLEATKNQENKNKYACEIAEYIRANRRLPLTTKSLASRFGYTPDHISRLLKKEFGMDAKTMIIKRRIEYIEALLINTDYSVREIAEQASFDNENAFVKFFKYHTGTTPSLFRHRFFNMHINSK